MGRIIGAGMFAAVLVALVQPAQAQGVRAWEGPIAEASLRFGIPVEWIRRVMRAESAGHTHRNGRPIRSRVGAMGLMQLMPGTWAAMRRAHGLGGDPDDPRDNVLAGTAYLRAMYDRFGYPGLFAAYNAGPARYAEHIARGRRLPAETVDYMAKVAGGPRGSAVDTLHSRIGSPRPHRGLIMPPGGLPAGMGADGGEPHRPSVFFPLGAAAPR